MPKSEQVFRFTMQELATMKEIRIYPSACKIEIHYSTTRLYLDLANVITLDFDPIQD